MSIQTNHDLRSVERHAHVALNGGYNDFPPGWSQITQDEFSRSHYFTFLPVMIEYRQMMPEDRTQPAVSARLEWHSNGEGFAIVNDYWPKLIKFYRFGVARHNYEGMDSSD